MADKYSAGYCQVKFAFLFIKVYMNVGCRMHDKECWTKEIQGFEGICLVGGGGVLLNPTTLCQIPGQLKKAEKIYGKIRPNFPRGGVMPLYEKFLCKALFQVVMCFLSCCIMESPIEQTSPFLLKKIHKLLQLSDCQSCQFHILQTFH